MPVEIDRSGRRACTPRLGPSTSSAPPPPRLMSVSENTVRQIKSKLMHLSSFGRRSCNLLKVRSDRPRAKGVRKDARLSTAYAANRPRCARRRTCRA